MVHRADRRASRKIHAHLLLLAVLLLMWLLMLRMLLLLLLLPPNTANDVDAVSSSCFRTQS